jgi:hypothetical protein
VVLAIGDCNNRDYVVDERRTRESLGRRARPDRSAGERIYLRRDRHLVNQVSDRCGHLTDCLDLARVHWVVSRAQRGCHLVLDFLQEAVHFMVECYLLRGSEARNV